MECNGRIDDDVLRETLQHEVAGKRKQCPSKRTWRTQVEEEIGKISLKKKLLIIEQDEEKA